MVRDWFLKALRARVRDDQDRNVEQVAELNRQLSFIRTQQDQLLNLRLLDEIETDTYQRKSAELRERADELKVKIEVADRSQAEKGEVAVKSFELSQTLEEKWVDGDYRANRQILEIVCSNFSLDGVTLSYTVNKPFDAMIDACDLKESGEGGIRTHGRDGPDAGFQNRSVQPLRHLTIGRPPAAECRSGIVPSARPDGDCI